MSKIILSEPAGPYCCIIDVQVMQVELREVFNGVRFVTEDGENLSVCMRDTGFEVRYWGNFGGDEDEGKNDWIQFKGGRIIIPKEWKT